MDLTADRLREFLHYEPETGVFTWKVSRRGKTRIGAIAGLSQDGRGYRRIIIDNKQHYEHRLVWLYVHGKWPSGQIDHANGDRADNRLCNLRLATHSENMCNSRMRYHNQAGLKGASWHQESGKWQARIRKDGVVTSLGYFSTPEEAHAAYVAAASKKHGKFARAA